MHLKKTYLFGAGASYAAVPTIDGIPNKMLELSNLLESNLSASDNFERFPENSKKSIYEYQEAFIDDLRILHSQSTKALYTVDEVAREYFRNSKLRELAKLKSLLTLLLIYCQLDNKVDPRYRKWYSDITSLNKDHLPDRINALTWNYDFQFEMSYETFSSQKDIAQNQKSLNVIGRRIQKVKDVDGFALFRLNGSASGYGSDQIIDVLLTDHFNYKVNREMIKLLVQQYARMLNWNNEYFGISFAWESPSDAFMKQIESTVNETSVLVVIGYSFPVVNNEVDSHILNSMKQLDKIYIQDVNPSIPANRIRVALNREVKIVESLDVNTFLGYTDTPV